MSGPVTVRRIPSADALKPGADRGWNCVWCGTVLAEGAVSVGISRGRVGVHVLDCEVWACPSCAKEGR